MNKTELIAEVAAKCAISKKDAEKTVNATFDTIAEALCKGDKVQLVGLRAALRPSAAKRTWAATPERRSRSRSPQRPFLSSRPARL